MNWRKWRPPGFRTSSGIDMTGVRRLAHSGKNRPPAPRRVDRHPVRLLLSIRGEFAHRRLTTCGECNMRRAHRLRGFCGLVSLPRCCEGPGKLRSFVHDNRRAGACRHSGCGGCECEGRPVAGGPFISRRVADLAGDLPVVRGGVGVCKVEGSMSMSG